MKRLFKILSMVMVLSFSVTSVKYVYAGEASAQSILKYQSYGSSASGRVTVYADLTVQDSIDEIIYYSIDHLDYKSNISNVNVVTSSLTANNTLVYVAVEYYFQGKYYLEDVYIGM